jgi:hypothetical protein
MAIRYIDEQKPEGQASSTGRTVLEQGLQGATFGFSDEVMDRLGAGIASIFTGEKYSDLLPEARGMTQSRMEQQVQDSPVTSIASNIAGGLLTGGALAAPKAIMGTAATTGARGALNAIPEAGQAIMRGVRTGGTGARLLKGGAVGAASGGLFGAGAAEEGERLGGATTGAALGGGFSVLAPVAIGTVKKGVDAVANEVTKRLAARAGEILPVERPFAKVVKRLRADFPDNAEFMKQINRYASSQGKSLVELSGKSTQNLAEGASMFPSAQKTAGEFFEAKIDMAPDTLKKVLSRTISPEVNYLDAVDDVVRVGQAKAAPLYKKAFSSNQQVESPLINRILETPEGVKAFTEARRNIGNEMALLSKPDPILTEMAKELNIATGAGVGRGFKLRTLDYVKRSMDSSIKTAIRQGDDGEVQRLVRLKNGLVGEIDRLDNTGAYAKARATAGDYLQTKEAMDMGTDFIKSDPQQLSRTFSGFSDAQKRAYKVGVVKSLNDRIDNTFDGRNVSQIFGKKSVRDKLQTILTPNQYNALKSQADEVDKIYKLRNQLTGNSRTAIRQVAAEEFNDETGQMLSQVATRGIRSVAVDKFASVIARKFSGMSDNAAADVASILYEVNPKEKAKIVRQLFNEYKSTSGIRQTQAAQKLEVFYALSDKLKQLQSATQAAAPAIGAAGGIMGGEQ